MFNKFRAVAKNYLNTINEDVHEDSIDELEDLLERTYHQGRFELLREQELEKLESKIKNA